MEINITFDLHKARWRLSYFFLLPFRLSFQYRIVELTTLSLTIFKMPPGSLMMFYTKHWPICSGLWEVTRRYLGLGHGHPTSSGEGSKPVAANIFLKVMKYFQGSTLVAVPCWLTSGSSQLATASTGGRRPGTGRLSWGSTTIPRRRGGSRSWPRTR